MEKNNTVSITNRRLKGTHDTRGKSSLQITKMSPTISSSTPFSQDHLFHYLDNQDSQTKTFPILF